MPAPSQHHSQPSCNAFSLFLPLLALSLPLLARAGSCLCPWMRRMKSLFEHTCQSAVGFRRLLHEITTACRHEIYQNSSNIPKQLLCRSDFSPSSATWRSFQMSCTSLHYALRQTGKMVAYHNGSLQGPQQHEALLTSSSIRFNPVCTLLLWILIFVGVALTAFSAGRSANRDSTRQHWRPAYMFRPAAGGSASTGIEDAGILKSSSLNKTSSSGSSSSSARDALDRKYFNVSEHPACAFFRSGELPWVRCPQSFVKGLRWCHKPLEFWSLS